MRKNSKRPARRSRTSRRHQPVPASQAVEVTLVKPVAGENLSIREFLTSDRPSFSEIVNAFKQRNRAVLRIQADVLDKKVSNG